MIEGFWIVQFEAVAGAGGGVVTFTKGQVFGGDSGATYLGSYESDGNAFKGRVRIHNYIAGVGSVLGIGNDDYDLEVTGMVEGDIGRGTGSPVGIQAAGLAFKMTRVSALPT